MKFLKKSLSLLLALVMVLGFLPWNLLAAEANALDVSDPSFCRVFHLDAGRKYYSLESLKKFVDMAAKNGYNQFNLYLSDSQGLRIKLDDMEVQTSKGTYDLSACVGDGLPAVNEFFAPCGTDGDDSTGYLTQAQIAELVSYAKEKSVAICPTINTPAHMGAILQDLTLDGEPVDLRADPYSNDGKEAVALSDEESMTFLTAMTKKFVDAFAEMGCEYYCIGGDEYRTGYPSGAAFDSFVKYVNDVGAYIKGKGMTPRMFNDAFTTNTSWMGISKDYEIYYWSALNPREDPQVLAEAGYKLINMPDNLYFVLRNDHENGWYLGIPTVSRINSEFNVYSFSTGESWRNGWSYIGVTGAAQANVIGAAFAIWSDNGTTWTTDEILTRVDPLSAALAVKAGYEAEGGGDSGGEGGSEETQPNPTEPTESEIQYNYGDGSGVTITMPTGQITGEFTIETTRKLTEADFVGESFEDSEVYTRIANVNIVKQEEVTSGGSTGELTKLTTLTAGDVIVISDGTYYLTCDGTNLGSTTDSTKATKWTVEKLTFQGESVLALNYGGKYLSTKDQGDSKNLCMLDSITNGSACSIVNGSLQVGRYGEQRYISLSASGVAASTDATSVCAYTDGSTGGGSTRGGEIDDSIPEFDQAHCNNQSYQPGDKVRFNGSVYECVKQTWSGTPESNTDCWKLVTSGGGTDPTDPNPTDPKPTDPESGSSTWKTTVTFTGKDVGHAKFTVTDTLKVNGEEQDGYFFDILVVAPGVHVCHGGTATCVSPATCAVCGKPYGAPDPNNHVHTVLQGKVDATTEHEGYTGDVFCTDCEKIVKHGETIPMLVPGQERIDMNEFATYTFMVPGEGELALNTAGMDTTIVKSVETKFVPAVPGNPTTKLTSVEAGQEVYISDGTNYLVYDVENDILTTTTNESEATRWTASVNNEGKIDLNYGSVALYYKNSSGAALVTDPSANGRWTFAGGDLKGSEWPSKNIVLSDGMPRLQKDGETGAVAGLYAPATGSPAGTKVTVTAGTQGETAFVLGATTYTVAVHPLDPTGKTIDIELFTSNTFCPVSGEEADAKDLAKLGLRENHARILEATEPGVATAEGVTLDQIMTDYTYSSGNDGDPVHVALLLRGTSHPAGHWQYSMQYTDGKLGGDYWDRDLANKFNEGKRKFGASMDKTDWAELGAKEFWHIRYYASGWEISNDGVTWEPVKSDEQLVARYMLETTVTEEVTTHVRDWANSSTNKEAWGKLDFAVKYESGDVFPTPDSYPIADKTLMYEADETQTKLKTDENGKIMRWVDDIWAVETTDREVYMITLTPTDDNPEVKIDKQGKYTYNGTEKIVWLDSPSEHYNKELPFHEDFRWGTAPTEEQAELLSVTHPGLIEAVGEENVPNIPHTFGDPLVNRVYIYKWQGMLVTYYLRAVKNEENLHVHYQFEDSQSYSTDDYGTDFFHYDIVPYEGVVFSKDFGKDDTNLEYGLTGNEVKNNFERIEHVTSKLGDITTMPMEYRVGTYEFVGTRRDSDNHVVLLYRREVENSFVVDFGFRLFITAKDLGYDDLQDTDEVEFTLVNEGKGRFGDLHIEEGNLLYVPNEILRDQEVFQVHMKVTGNDGQTVEKDFSFAIYPATTVYYELSQRQYYPSGQGVQKPNDYAFLTGMTGSWFREQNIDSYRQQTHVPGMDGAFNYGYDSNYGTDLFVGPEEGNTVYSTHDFTTYIASDTIGDSVTMEFTGTGFELYANCGETTGSIMASLYMKQEDGSYKLKRLFNVDTIFKGGESGLTDYLTGLSVVNIPVISMPDGLEYGDYRLVVKHVKSKVDADSRTKIKLDGLRVYGTMDHKIDSTVYALDHEANPTFIEPRDALLAAAVIPDSCFDPENKDGVYAEQIAESILSQVYASGSAGGVTAVLLTVDKDNLTENEIKVDVLNNGPKNEIYLRPGQSLLMNLGANYSETYASVQLGMKGLTLPKQVSDSKGPYMTYSVNGDKKELHTNTDLYYRITPNEDGTILVTNTSENDIMAVTQLKLIPHGTATTEEEPLMAMSLPVMTRALAMLGFQTMTEEPEETEPVDATEATEAIEATEATEAPEATEATEAPETPETEWQSGKVYVGGDTVTYNGKTYKAKWWTNNEQPGKADVWELVSAETEKPDSSNTWNSGKVYVGGDTVTVNGVTYRAKWWCLGERPGQSEVWAAV